MRFNLHMGNMRVSIVSYSLSTSKVVLGSKLFIRSLSAGERIGLIFKNLYFDHLKIVAIKREKEK